MRRGLRRGELATAAGVNLETVRYYERRGLLHEPDRSDGGHRLYTSEAVTLVRIIKAAQRLGFTLDEVAELLDVARHRHDRCGGEGLQAKAASKLAEVEAKITDLEVIRTSLTAALQAGCDDLATCACRPLCPLPFAQLGQSDHGDS